MRGAYAQRRADARTASIRIIKQFRLRGTLGNGHPDDVMFGGGTPFCDPPPPAPHPCERGLA